MAVKFKMAHTVGTLYAEGEVAGFDKDVEADLVKRKIAEPYKGKDGEGAEGKPAEPKA